jgi:L-2-hydroxyglutarate oxidase LhgO
MLVNSAGLHAPELARRFENFPTERAPPAFYTKGHPFTRGGRAPFRHLVNPMPKHAGLRIHVTLDLGGQCKFGPDASGWEVSSDYSFEEGLEENKFYRAIRRCYRDLPDGSLQPGYTGIRPKVVGPTQPAGDFIVQGPDAHGVSGLVNLFGIESPGLTSCLAIAEKVAKVLNHHNSHHVLPTIAPKARLRSTLSRGPC